MFYIGFGRIPETVLERYLISKEYLIDFIFGLWQMSLDDLRKVILPGKSTFGTFLLF